MERELQYNRALQKIKRMNRIITEKEWNRIAKEENLLSTESLKYMTRKTLKQLCIEVMNQQNFHK